MKTGNLNGQGIAELQNFKFQNLSSAPTTNLAGGRFYFSTVDSTFYIYNGSTWKDALSQGMIYTEGSGIDITGNVISIDNTVTAGTKCKITYDANGLVTAGADLQASDIPNLTLSKITDVTATATEVNVLDGITASTAELNIMDGVTVTASDINSVTSKISLTSLSIDSGSSNYLGYDNTTGKFSAKVDTTVTASSSKLITSGAVSTAISNAIANVYKAKGTVAFASLPTLGSSEEGNVYNISDAFTTTSDFVEGAGKSYPAGTNVVCINTTGTTYKWDVLAGTIDTSSFITASSTDTLTNKTIDADDNTISDLATGNFKSGVIVTSVGSTGADTSIPTEKAVRSAITSATSGMVTASSTTTFTNKTFDANGTGNSISNLETADFASGVIQTSVRATSSASDSAIASEKAVATALGNKAGAYSVQNGALTASGGVCTWTVTHSLGSKVGVHVYEVSSGEEVLPNSVVKTSSTVATIELLSASNISAGTYEAVVIGL